MPRATVSKEFRELLLAEYPGLAKDPAYWRLFGWMSFGRLTERSGVLVTKDVLASLEGKQHQLNARNYSGAAFLEAFKRDVVPTIEWSEYIYSENKAREITNFGLNEVVMQASQQERATPVTVLNERVYIDSGLRWTPARQKQHREEDRTTAMRLLSKAGCREAQRLMEYLNNLPANRFTKALSHLDDAYIEAHRLENPRSRESALRLLRNIADQPQPLYGPTTNGRTVRLFSTNESLCQLPRQVRKILTREWTSVDLKSAQLAIVSRLWHVPAITEYLRSGVSVWQDLCKNLDVAYTEDTKKGVKRMLYALVFGSGKRADSAIAEVAREHFPNELSLVSRFFQVPLIDELYRGRKIAEEQILSAGGTIDAFGNWISLPAGEYRQPNVRSVLASQAQSYELRLLWPVIDEALRCEDFDITLYLFDGLSLAFKDTAKKGRILNRLKNAVDAVAAELDMPTSLDIDAG